MRSALTVAAFVAAVAANLSVPLEAQTKASSTYTSPLVLAQCPGPLPCNTGITFTHGTVRFKKIKQPGPVFSTFLGRISLQGVIPALGDLDAVVSAQVTYGPDANGNCPLANTQGVINPWATSSLTCIPSGFGFYALCRGDLNLTSLLPAACSDVDMVVEDLRAQVYESGMVGVPANLIARDGHAGVGNSPDCDSGGSGGCP